MQWWGLISTKEDFAFKYAKALRKFRMIIYTAAHGSVHPALKPSLCEHNDKEVPRNPYQERKKDRGQNNRQNKKAGEMNCVKTQHRLEHNPFGICLWRDKSA